MIKKKVFLHIGPPKTGSTTIQNFLSQAYESLLDQGILYPLSGRMRPGESYKASLPTGKSHIVGPIESHQLVAWTLMGEVENLDPYSCWSSILSEFKQTKAHSMILSGEAFARLPKDRIIQLQSFLLDYKPTIIFYFRDPFSRTLSLYTQEVKMGRYFRSFSNFLHEREPELFYYEGIFERWKDCFGIENILVKSFDQITNNSNLESDLLLSLDQKPENFSSFIKQNELNRSPSPKIVKLLCTINQIEHSLDKYHNLQNRFQLIRKRIRRQSLEWKLFGMIIGKFWQHSLFTEADRLYVKELTEKPYQKFLNGQSGRGLHSKSVDQ